MKWTGIVAKRPLEVKEYGDKKVLFLKIGYNPSQKAPIMKILLAPSETKKPGGDQPFRIETLLFEPLLSARQSLLITYMNVLQRGNAAELSRMFGLKKEVDIAYHAAKDLPNEPAMRAIERYTGVAFDHLDYSTLSLKGQQYLHEHLILHSNLFGFLRADDMIPEYRLGQGKAVGDLLPEKLYREAGTPLMNTYLEGEDILDLRAGFYDKVYRPSHPYTVLKFLKGGKVVSHWAKAYRGVVLRAVAEASIADVEAFMKLPIQGLNIAEMQTRKLRTEIIYTIES